MDRRLQAALEEALKQMERARMVARNTRQRWVNGAKWSLVGMLALVGAGAQATPELQGHEAEVALVVSDMVRSYHYEKRAIDDAASEEWMQAYIERLDGSRFFFLQSDIDQFKRFEDVLDDELKAEKLDTAMRLLGRYQERVDERMQMAIDLLDSDLDVETDRTFVYDRKKANLGWAKDEAEAKQMWKDRVTDALIVGLLQGNTLEDRKETLRKRYTRIQKETQEMESSDALELYLHGFTHMYDPHSVWFKPATRDNFDIEISNSVEVIVASLRVVDEYTTVIEVIPGGPAEQDGRLQPKDRIVAVAQGDGPFEDVVDLRIDKVVKHIRGKKGSKVRLKIIPAGKPVSETTIIDIKRDRVLLAESDAEKTIHEVNGKKVGVIDVPSFYIGPRGTDKGVSNDVRRLLGELEAEGAESVILDLRMNGGGSLPEAIEMAGLFIGGGPVVLARDRTGQVEVYNDPDRKHVWKKKVIVLTSPLSASASEIVAGALQDYGRAIIVGAEQTHGKGTVQQIVGVSQALQNSEARQKDLGGALKLTIQKFYRVSGASTQLKGVESDLVLPSPYDGLDVYEGDLDNALEWDAIPPAPHHSYGELDGVVSKLTAKSKARVASDQGFIDLNELLAKRAEFKEETSVPLNLTKRKELDNDREEPDEDLDAEKEEEDEDDPVLDETLRIMGDWMAG